MLLNLNEANFDKEVLETNKTVLIDFYADWCQPCKMLAPIIKELAEEAPEGVIIAKVNVDEAPELASKYNVVSIPTLVVIKDKEVIKTSLGYQSKEKIKELIKV